jgi:hypothetical protein
MSGMRRGCTDRCVLMRTPKNLSQPQPNPRSALQRPCQHVDNRKNRVDHKTKQQSGDGPLLHETKQRHVLINRIGSPSPFVIANQPIKLHHGAHSDLHHADPANRLCRFPAAHPLRRHPRRLVPLVRPDLLLDRQPVISPQRRRRSPHF